MKLIGSLTSPFVRKVRIVLAEKKLDYQFVLDDVWGEAPVVQEANPLSKVPCLVMEGGEAIFDSRVIVEYVDTLSPVGKLVPVSGRERLEVRTWEALADGLLDAAILVRLENTWAGRTPEQRSAAWIEHQMKKIHASLAAMSRALGDKPACTLTPYSLADIAVGCSLSYLDFRFPELRWRDSYTNLDVLLNRLSQRSSFIDTAPPASS